MKGRKFKRHYFCEKDMHGDSGILDTGKEIVRTSS